MCLNHLQVLESRRMWVLGRDRCPNSICVTAAGRENNGWSHAIKSKFMAEGYARKPPSF
jgi:hypothetical protein